LHGVRVRELAAHELDEGLEIVVRAMRDNPLHVKAFGGDTTQREEAVRRLQRALVNSVLARGDILCAERNGAVIGVLGMAGRRLTRGETARMGLTIATGFSPWVAKRLVRWFGQWVKRVPKADYVHLGPVAVDVPQQGQGVGTVLMEAFCHRMDELGALAYLETDSRRNVEFYRKFGFGIVDKAAVIGVPNWFMIRQPAD
jgi:GNAT superfamily N-acetyltransferase